MCAYKHKHKITHTHIHKTMWANCSLTCNNLKIKQNVLWTQSWSTKPDAIHDDQIGACHGCLRRVTDFLAEVWFSQPQHRPNKPLQVTGELKWAVAPMAPPPVVQSAPKRKGFMALSKSKKQRSNPCRWWPESGWSSRNSTPGRPHCLLCFRDCKHPAFDSN